MTRLKDDQNIEHVRSQRDHWLRQYQMVQGDLGRAETKIRGLERQIADLRAAAIQDVIEWLQAEQSLIMAARRHSEPEEAGS
jgi:hypothetical protein